MISITNKDVIYENEGNEVNEVNEALEDGTFKKTESKILIVDDLALNQELIARKVFKEFRQKVDKASRG